MFTVSTQNPASELVNEQQIKTICIPTATAIVYCKENPFCILIGDSAKHTRPVLPGGKIDLKDICSSSILVCARKCIQRELKEEISLETEQIDFFRTFSDPMRDRRIINVSSLQGSLVSILVNSMKDSDKVIGLFGMPDFVFLVPVEKSVCLSTEELKTLRWVDCRSNLEFGAGHKEILIQYSLYLLGQ